ncbi:MAG: exonuclease domain-containing protein [Lachnospiraceae bacterium]|nr:exonuclease domain-containing protein [Lachnospiraceae bacterium]
MNYIVFDLEWNQPEDGLKTEDRVLPFEIIEIGAVKLNEELDAVSEFNMLIKPQVYHSINWRIRKMLELKPGELEKGTPFPEAAGKFLEWCGEDHVFCTWGSQDLTELQRNMNYHGLPDLSDKPIRYMNVQKMYGVMNGIPSQTKALESAVDALGIEKDVPFHRAYSDAYYTAKILKLIPEEIRRKYKAYDVYHLPKNRKTQIKLKEGEKQIVISTAYPTKEALMDDGIFTALNCVKCSGKAVKQKIRWHSFNQRVYDAAGKCKEHGYLASRIKIKHSDAGDVYGEKATRYITEEEFLEMRKSLTKHKD